jgi:protein-tyrosine phosphatase
VDTALAARAHRLAGLRRAAPTGAGHQLRLTLCRIERAERVEVACGGGRGRTGTALAALAVLQGSTVDDAITWIRSVYDGKAVESRARHRFLRTITPAR